MDLIDKELDDLYKEVNARQKNLKIEAKYRSFLAYFLKLVAVLVSLVITGGFCPSLDQFFGLVVAAAVAIDHIFSNHKRLLVAKEAANALWALKRKVKHEFNGKAAPLYRRTNNTVGVQDKIENLKSKAQSDLAKGISRIQQEINDVELDALKSLSLGRKSS